MKNKLIKNLQLFFNNYRNEIFIALPFLILDWGLQLLGSEIFYFPFALFMPLFFTVTWLFFILSICLNLKRRSGLITYTIFLIIAFILFITNGIYYSKTNNFFDFSLLGLANEAKDYILASILHTNIFVFITILVFAFFTYKAYKLFPNNKKADFRKMGKLLICFLIVHTFLPILYGPSNKNLTWSTWKNAQNVYLRFNDNNKSFSITGLYEYSVRNLYMTFIKPEETENENELDFLNGIYSKKEKANKNSYTGLFKNNNIIFIQLEGIDSWLLTEETMPNLYKMQNNAINFKNHYSFYNGGGSTFNSEFAVNTGFITPITYNRNAYTFNRNEFTYSLANTFKEENYSIDAFHMNSSEYYSRGINYENWGYDNYYGLKDIKTYLNYDYQLDTELILNETFYDLMFKKEGNFVNYLITYSNHMPFSSRSGVCRQLISQDLENELITKDEISGMTEEDCIKRQAKETDDMIGLLKTALEENNLDENTVLVIFADHYLYTISDQSILEKYKETSNNLINNTPFLIYKKGLKRKDVTNVTSQIDILPTILNLFGFNYNKNYYLGSDALDNKYKGLVFFNDYSWYDGNCYIKNGEIDNNCNINFESLEDKNNQVDFLIKKNDLTLKYDYFKKMSEEKIEK